MEDLSKGPLTSAFHGGKRRGAGLEDASPGSGEVEQWGQGARCGCGGRMAVCPVGVGRLELPGLPRDPGLQRRLSVVTAYVPYASLTV